MTTKTFAAIALSSLVISCADDITQGPVASPRGKASSEPIAEDSEKKPVPALKAEEAPPESDRLDPASEKPRLDRIRNHFANTQNGRIYVQVDKPLYKPGETIWFRAWALDSKGLSPRSTAWHRYELVSPKGAVVLNKRVRVNQHVPANDFTIPDGVQGGEYKLRVVTADGLSTERPIVVSTYEAPRIKKKLEFLRKAYGVGATVKATIEVKRPTGAPLTNHPLRPVGTVDGLRLRIPQAKTDAQGEATIQFQLPEKIQRADGLLTVMIEDGGITESISKRIPIVLKKIQMGFFPEGGDLVQGMESRLYFEAKNSIGKPADVAGHIVDDLGNPVAEFTTYHKGLGRVMFTPASGRKYHVEITEPAGVKERYALPLARAEGCVLRTYDDLDGEIPELRLRVSCTEERDVLVVGTLRDEVFDTARVTAKRDGAVVYLKPKEGDIHRRGIARVTVFTDANSPVAERLVFRNRRKGLEVKLSFDKKRYAPRDTVQVAIETRSPNGAPVAAELALSVVDDTVISFADDKTGHLTSSVLFETEIPGKVEEPKFFLDLTEEKSALALELLMGTRGYRRFEWEPIFAPPRPQSSATVGGIGRGGAAVNDMAFGAKERARPARQRARRQDRARFAAPAPMRKPAPGPKPAKEEAAAALREPVDLKPEELADEAPMEADREVDRRLAKAPRVANRDADWGGALVLEKKKKVVQNWAPVREFPMPAYTGQFDGVRSDFRETIYWDPRVKTGNDGKASVRFFLSDAVTSFRVFAEGTGAGAIGREEKTFESSLPFSLNVKLPLEVSAGDQPKLPLTLSNERDTKAFVSLSASFGDLLKLEGKTALPEDGLNPKQRASLFYPLTVTGVRGKSKVRFAAASSGLTDEIVREVNVVPKGFPRVVARSGSVGENTKVELDLTGAIEGTAKAQITVYPSVTATLLSGLEGMLREPYGCFEQTSSSNYPNVLVMGYLQSSGQGNADVLARAGTLLDKGYKRLVGFETQQKGYEWFGGTPAHEALTAYGVLEFSDMKRVYGGVDDAMLTRTIGFLERRRDGNGGFKRDSQALDSFGRANPSITDAYITYAVTEAGYGERFQKEVATLFTTAEKSQDAYVLALAANTLLTIPSKKREGKAVLAKLLALQKPDGSFDGSEHSITRSTGINLSIETTGLAVMAMLKVPGNLPRAQKAVGWLIKQRRYGAFGATQATVMALRAITAFGQTATKAASSGEVTVSVNGKVVANKRYEAGQSDALVFDGFEALLSGGNNTVTVSHRGKSEIPFEVGVEYYVDRGQDHPGAGLNLETEIAANSLKMGDNVRMTARIENTLEEGRPMTLARIGLPGGLTYQTWQLKELREQGIIDFYETKAREVILYFRQMKPGQQVEVPIELTAVVPGQYTSPASRAYLYYTDDKKVWADPIAVVIEP